MDLVEVSAFLAVAETGSFAAAAQKLGCPRTTLTRRIDALEARAGTKLLERGRSGAKLTAAVTTFSMEMTTAPCSPTRTSSTPTQTISGMYVTTTTMATWSAMGRTTAH